jgi:hypothetical protein
MSVALEVPQQPLSQEYQPDAEGIEGYLEAVSELPTPQQLQALMFDHFEDGYAHFQGYRTSEDPKTADALAGFAAAENSTPSLSVRLEALERALERGFGQELFTGKGREWNDVQEAARVQGAAPRNRRGQTGVAYRYIEMRLLEGEGIDDTTMFPDWSPEEVERGIKDHDSNPVRAYAFLDKVQAEIQSGEPSALALQFVPLLQSIHDRLTAINRLPDTPDIYLRDWKVVGDCQRLLADQDIYRRTLVDVLNTKDPVALQCVEKLSTLCYPWPRHDWYDAFPDRYAKATHQAYNRVLSDALYAVLHHAAHGNSTDVSLPLKNGQGLPLKLGGDEPLHLLDTLGKALTSMPPLRFRYDPYLRTVKVAEAPGYAAYRFIQVDAQGHLKPYNVSAYIREYGDVTYDSALEYGRPGQGVEASFGYIVDTDCSRDGLMEVGKHHREGDDARISIRLDREGVAPQDRDSDVPHDPTQQQGTLSLDVGSVLGKDEWTSTKLGRFLALGNALRAQANGDRIDLNHVVDYFTAEDGDADVFAAAVGDVKAMLESKRLTTAEIAVLVAGSVRPAARLLAQTPAGSFWQSADSR